MEFNPLEDFDGLHPGDVSCSGSSWIFSLTTSVELSNWVD